MPDLLTADDLTAIRREGLGDEIDLHPEWGSAPRVASIASAAATSLALKALGTGTIKRGTRFTVTSGGVVSTYTVTADVTIAAGAATVSISPLLVRAAAVDDVVTVEAYRRSVFNKTFGRQLFTDVDLQLFAEQAEELYGQRIAASVDPVRQRRKAVTLFGLKAMLLPGSEFRQALAIADPTQQGRVEIDSLDRTVKELQADVAFRSRGMAVGEVYL